MVWVVLSCSLIVALFATVGFALVQMGRAHVAEDRLSYVLKQWEWDQVLDKVHTIAPQPEKPGRDWDVDRCLGPEKDTYEGV